MPPHIEHAGPSSRPCSFAGIVGGSSVSAIIDDFATATANRAMYDGLGYALVSLAGDYNGDGIVDAADYVVWRKQNGSQTDYNTWRSNYGKPSGSGSGTSEKASVPEPTTLVLLMFAVAAWCLRRPRTA